MSKEKPDVLLIELCKQGHSGFFQDDTIGTGNPIELKSASLTYVPTTGYRGVKWTDPATGKEIRKLEQIRWIKGQDEILVSKQKELGLEPERSGNVITIERDAMAIVKEGANVGLYNYLNEVSFNENAIMRSEKATALYRTLKADQNTDELNEKDLIQADAVKFVGELYAKKADGKYLYKEDKIDSYCNMFGIVADSFSGKINGLMSYAKMYSKEFLEKAVKLEQTTITEISHALQLNVIKFDKSVAMYATKDSIIKDLGGVKMSLEDKVENLAAYFRTADGADAYKEFKAELEYAQEKALKNS